MAQYGSDDVVLEFDASVGGALGTITPYVDEINGIEINAILEEEAHTFGDAWVETLYTGLKRAGNIVLSGFYDDAVAPAPNAIFNAPGEIRTFKITYGGTKTTSVETMIESFVRNPVRNRLTRYTVTLRPTGVVTEA